MNILGIDAHILAQSNYTGITRCLYEILKVWSKTEQNRHIILFTNKPLQLNFVLPQCWTVVCKPFVINRGIFWENIVLPKLIAQYGVDVFWGPDFKIPAKKENVKYFVTIHDLALFLFRGIGSNSNVIKHFLFTKSACQRADGIISVSQATKKDVISLFSISEEKIFVSHNGGIPSDFQNYEPDVGNISNKLVFPEKFLLFLSTIEPRKNISVIVKAFDKYVENTGSTDKLILAGKEGWKTGPIHEVIDHAAHKDQIILTGYISENEKRYLLTHADVFLYPSIYEGFGIPILEAMEYGIPIITSNVSAMPEVGGDAVMYLNNVDSAEELCMLIQTARNLSEQEKEVLRNKMQQQKKKFSWGKNASEVMKILDGKSANL